MADNVEMNPGTGGEIFASDDISGVQYPRGKITLGADGVNDGDVSDANPMPAKTMASTTGGLAVFKHLDLDETPRSVKGSAGQVYWMHVTNYSVSTRYLKLYNIASGSVTVGLSTPMVTIPIASIGDTEGSISNISLPIGITFSTAITAVITTGKADNDTGAPGADEIVITIGYK